MAIDGITIMSIYSGCSALLEIKRKILQNCAFPQIKEPSALSSEERVCSNRILICFKKIFHDFSSNLDLIVSQKDAPQYYGFLTDSISQIKSKI